MAQENRAVIVVKRVVKGGDGHHGGAWKVAYADFVTAMMAFFLLMWLLNATTEKQRKGLADYFDPSVPLARTSAGGSDLLGGESMMTRESRAGGDARETTSDARGARIPEPVGEGAPRPGEAEGATGPGTTHDTARRAEEERLSALASRMEQLVSAAGEGLERHFLVSLTVEGLVVEIVDSSDRPLFASGSAQPAPMLTRLIGVIVPVLDRVSNRVAVVGHTDATPFSRGDYGNWELSADRANAARRLMTAAGMPEARIARVTGRGATAPLSEDPAAPQNRRIAITLLREAPR